MKKIEDVKNILNDLNEEYKEVYPYYEFYSVIHNSLDYIYSLELENINKIIESIEKTKAGLFLKIIKALCDEHQKIFLEKIRDDDFNIEMVCNSHNRKSSGYIDITDKENKSILLVTVMTHDHTYKKTIFYISTLLNNNSFKFEDRDKELTIEFILTDPAYLDIYK